MRRVLPWIGGAFVAVALGVVLPPAVRAINARPASGELAPYILPSPMVAHATRADGGHFTCAMPAGAPGCCVYVGAGVSARVTCDAATPCYYRAVAIEADAGFPLDIDGGFAMSGADVYLPAGSPETLGLPYSLDSICATTADGGTLQAPERYP